MNVRVVECSGAPRDLGRDLGCALRAEVRAAVSEQGTLRGLLASLRESGATTRLHRDLRRYFPHQSEWLEGLALGSGVALRVLVRALAVSCAPGAPQGVAIGAVSGTAVAVASAVPRGALWRRVAPEGRFRSLEVALPAATAPVIGVNEAGLAVAVAEQRSLPGRFAPPLALFARDCLERFERVEPALDWCLARPAAPGGSLAARRRARRARGRLRRRARAPRAAAALVARARRCRTRARQGRAALRGPARARARECARVAARRRARGDRRSDRLPPARRRRRVDLGGGVAVRARSGAAVPEVAEPRSGA